MNKIRINTRNYTIRQESMEGISYLVVPVIMIQEGVHAGSDGAIYHSPEQLGRYVEAWNGIPVTIAHPQFNDSFVSANSPTILEQYAVGQVFKTRLEGSQLRAEAWIKMDKIQSVSQQTLNLLNNGEPIDVSVGVFTDSIDTPGTWEGKEYYKIATNYRPDHLAVLPFEEGACSYNDGCGIRNNNKVTNKQTNEMDLKLYKVEFLKQNPLQVNADYVERANVLQRLLDDMDRDGVYHYLEELYEDHFFYKVTGGTVPAEYFKQKYSENSDGELTFVGDAEKMVRTVTYTPPSPLAMSRTTKSKKDNPLKINKMDVTKKVDELIANTNSCFCADDREYLLTQSDEKLGQFAEKAIPKKEEPKVYATPEEYIETLPEGMRDSMRNGLKLHTEQRAALIEKISTNAKDVWSADDLNAMSSEMLSKVAGTIPAIKEEGVDYTLQGTAPGTYSKEDAVLMPTGMEVEKK